MRMDLEKSLKLGGAVTAGLAGIFGATTAGAWYRLFKRPLPQTKGELQVDGVDGEVEIRRDRWGVPHVRASSDHDLWFGQGFCHGQDRLWQLDVYRRVVSGRLSEIAGPDGLTLDRFMRTLGLHRIGAREAGELDPETRAIFDAHCAGVNAAAGAAKALPAEFQILRRDWEPWRPADL